MKRGGKRPAYQDRVEVIHLLEVLRSRANPLAHAIDTLQLDLKRDYWTVEQIARMKDLIEAFDLNPELFPRIAGRP